MSREAFGSFITKGVDLWSMGVTFNEMFALEMPFEGMTVTQIAT